MAANDYTRVVQGAQVTTYSFCAGDATRLLGHELELGEPLSSEVVDNSKSRHPPGIPSLVLRNSSAVVDTNIGTIDVAIILFGDPSHNANASYNYGTAAGDGVSLRRNPNPQGAGGFILLTIY
jgi:hypothetical protein